MNKIPARARWGRTQRAFLIWWACWLTIGVAVELWAAFGRDQRGGTLTEAWSAFWQWADSHTWDDLRIVGRTVSTIGVALSTAAIGFLVWAAIHLPGWI